MTLPGTSFTFKANFCEDFFYSEHTALSYFVLSEKKNQKNNPTKKPTKINLPPNHRRKYILKNYLAQRKPATYAVVSHPKDAVC